MPKNQCYKCGQFVNGQLILCQECQIEADEIYGEQRD